MDPVYVDNELWNDLSTMLRFLWLYFLIINGFVVSFLIAHAIIPSLVDSGQLPPRLARLRPLFYLNALGILVTALAVFLLLVINADVIGRIWGRWWI